MEPFRVLYPCCWLMVDLNTLLLSLHLEQDNTDDQNALHAAGPTATMLGPQLMSLSPLQSSLQCDFGMIAIVSSVLYNQELKITENLTMLPDYCELISPDSPVRIKVTRPSFFWGVPSYFEALWYPRLYFYRKSNT